jgi:hypothetical protein
VAVERRERGSGAASAVEGVGEEEGRADTKLVRGDVAEWGGSCGSETLPISTPKIAAPVSAPPTVGSDAARGDADSTLLGMARGELCCGTGMSGAVSSNFARGEFAALLCELLRLRTCKINSAADVARPDVISDGGGSGIDDDCCT